MPKVSILVPIFNVEKYLEECLDSVVNQTLKDIEIICINDGSTDDSLNIIKRYAKKDDRIVIIDKKNSGYGDSMNKGIKKAKGKYIGIVESDDFVEKNMFADLYNLAETHDVEVVKSDFWYYFEFLDKNSSLWNEEYQGIYSNDHKSIISEHNIKAHLIPDADKNRLIDPRKENGIFYQKPAIWSAIYRRDFLNKNNISFLPSPGASYQDTGFNFKVWASCRKAYFTDRAYLHYRQDNEASSVNNPGKVFCVSDEYAEIEKYLRKHKLLQKFGSLMEVTKYGAYSWNYNRLSLKLAEDFLQKFSEEYKHADSNGLLNLSMFSTRQRQEVIEIIENPKMFSKRRKAREKALISIVVPIYNVEKYLHRCLESLQNQTFKEIEVICVIDASPDNSLEIAEKFYKSDPRFSIIVKSKNSGLGATRNTGINAASARTIMFCDSDDSFNEFMCEEMYRAKTENNANLAVCEPNISYSGKQGVRYRTSDEAYYRLPYSGKVSVTDTVIASTDVAAWNKIFDTSIIRKYQIYFPNNLWYEDALFFYKYMLVSSSVYYLKGKKLYNYYRHDEGIMAKTSNKDPRAVDHLRVAVHLYHFMKDRGILSASNTGLYIDLFKNCYEFSKRHTPADRTTQINNIVKGFVETNKEYMDTVDSSLAPAILDVLPVEVQESVNPKAPSVKIRIKNTLYKILLRISPNYRNQRRMVYEIMMVRKEIAAMKKLTQEKDAIIADLLGKEK